MLRKKALMAILTAGLISTSIPAVPVSLQAAETTGASTTTEDTTILATADYDKENATLITFSDNAVSASGAAADSISIKNDTSVTIDKSGVYVFSGSCKNGSIAVKKNTTDVTIVLDGLDLTSEKTAPISCKSSTDTRIIVNAGTTNSLTDAASDSDDDDGQAGIKVKKDSNFTIVGSGTLTIDGQVKNAIKVGANVICNIKDVNLNITSAKHGISVEHKLIVEGGNLNINAQNDGIKASPDTDSTTGTTTTDATTSSASSNSASTDSSEGSILLAPDSCTIQAKGDGIQAAKNIQLTSGTYDITASQDGIQADNDITISAGSYTIQTNGGSSTTLTNTSDSCKGIKAKNNISILGGTFDLNSADDAVHSNAYITVADGTFKILTGDDGFHADTALTVGAENTTGPSIDIQKSYEGLEAATVTLNSGTVSVTASDDGVNAAGKSSGNNDSFQPGGQRPGAGNSSSGEYSIHINGGTLDVNCGGDGLDSNGDIYISGGDLNIQSAAANGGGSDNFPFDHDGTMAITGGTIFGAGSNQMVELPDSTASTQTYTAKSLNSVLTAGTKISIQNASGKSLVTEDLLKNTNFVFYSSAEMSSEDTYTVVNATTGETIASSDATSMGGGGGFPGGGGGFPGGGGGFPGGGGGFPGGGSMPSLPSGVSMPSLPSGVSMPSLPSGVSMPSRPDGDTMPSKPDNVSSTPAAPSDDSQPSSPDSGSSPAVPGNDGTPSTPSGDISPSFPWGDFFPSLPWDDLFPSEPSEPSESVTPSQPASSEKPSKPSKPSEDETPSQPASASKPTDSEKPSQDASSEKPSKPSEPSESVTPSQPALEPSVPSETETPSQPNATTKPTEPEGTVSAPTTSDTEKPSPSEAPSQTDTTVTITDAKKAGLSLRLSSSTYKYNAKVHKPNVVVTTKDGQTVSASNYKVSYSGTCKKVGTYTVTVTFSGEYSGTLKKTFTIKPSGTSIKKLTASKKGFTIKLQKQSSQTNGYQIQYSVNKNFVSGKTKTLTVTNTSLTSRKITRLVAKQKYFVRVRTYKTVNGKNIVSAWSAVKTITTK